METLETAPGVVRLANRIFVTWEDVTELLGCRKSKAYNVIHEVNECARKKGNRPFPSGKANKYLFSEIYGIPIEEVDGVIGGRQEVWHGVL